jgi:glutathione S-transferase
MTTLTATSPRTLHGFKLSGHSHRAELFLSLLGLPYHFEAVNLGAGAHKSPEFLARNVFGEVPVLDDGDITIADSNAILIYLAQRYAPGVWLPSDAVGAAHVQRWLSVASGLLAYGAGAARLVTLFKSTLNASEAIARAHRLLAVMERELAQRDFLVGTSPSLADVALYSYTALAPEGNVSLDAYPQVRAWLTRIEALPGFIPMPQSAVGLRA